MDISVAALRNDGVPVRVAKLDTDGTPLRGNDGTIIRDERRLQFTANTIAELEAFFSRYETTNTNGEVVVLHGDRALERMSRDQPTRTVRQVFAIAWKISAEEAGALMLTDEQAAYLASINAALAMAQGMDPTLAVEMIRLGIEVADDARAKMEAVLTALASESPGQTGSEPGSGSGDQSMSSGG